MDAYKTLGAAGESYFEDRRSEFYGFAFPVATEAEALARIGEIKARFPDARHHVYAYCLREGFCTRFTDDREPQGSAGMPVLDVLRKGSIQDAVIIVVRYFGGVKLGAGGLIRAYSSCVADNLDKADVRALCVCAEEKITVDYTGVDALQKYLATQGAVILDTEYGEKVTVKTAIKKTDEQAFLDGLIDYLQGRVSVEKTGEYYFPF